jgi:hypothetical protein
VKRRLAAVCAALGIIVAATTFATSNAGAWTRGVPPVKHVFVIVLENENADVSFGPNSPAPYLAKTLPRQGQFLDQYYGTGHFSLDNYISMISGQAPNAMTQADCQVFLEFLPGVPGPDGQSIGQGCVYPSGVKTVADQLAAKGLRWKGYMEDMGTPCRHPAINARDETQSAKVGDQYASRHNPFVYFHSIIDTPACAANVVDLKRLTNDLARERTTPNLAFITPNLCHDGHDAPCVNGEPGGLRSADAFLRAWVPRILTSPAYKKDGLLVVMFDEAEALGANVSDSSACCGEPAGPNSPLPGQTGPGGGRTGAVLISRFIKPGSVNHTPYNHYSLLRSMEDMYGVPYLGYAGRAGLKGFARDVFNR